VADRLRKRERDLQELVEREGNEATQRIQIALGDIERRQVEQLQRIVSRETTRYAESASIQFDSTIKSAREEAARRLSRELDLAVERFSREAEGVLTERLNHVSDAAAQRVEDRLARLRAALERQRDDALRSLEDRSHDVESSLRERLAEIASDAEAERAVLEARLHDLSRRLDELAARA
jgi:type IV secretory pathway VirB4 component